MVKISLKNIFVAIFITIFSWGCSLFKTIEFETADGLYIEQLGYKVKSLDDNKKILVSSGNDTMEMTVNRRIALFNGTKIWMYFPLTRDQYGDLRIRKVDFEKIINPLFSRNMMQKTPVKRIVIDAGHGNEDAGAIGKFSKEKDLNLSLSLKIKKSLEAKCFEVIMTRDSDIFLTLDARSEFAEKNNADLFLCIHHNAAAGVKTAHGIETYSLTAADNAGTHDKGKNVTATHERKGNKFDTQNVILNHLVQSKIIADTKAFDRGSKFARYKVLVLAPCPAILLEAGFVSNPKEEVTINSPEYQDKIASAVAEAVAEFANIKQ